MNMKRLKAMFMSEKEFDLYVEALDKGLLEAERNMLHEKAALQLNLADCLVMHRL